MGTRQHTSTESSDSLVAAESESRGATRRSLLGKSAAVAGGVGLAAVTSVDPAIAAGEGRFDGFLNVQDWDPAYPVVPNDSSKAAQNRTSLQLILDSAGDPGGPPGTVYFPPGTWYVNGALEIPSNVTMTGHGVLSVLKRSDSGGGALLESAPGGVSDIRISRLTLEGGSGTQQVVYIRDATRVRVSEVEVRNSTSALVQLEAARATSVENCHFRATGGSGSTATAVYVTGASEDILIKGNIFGGGLDQASNPDGVGRENILVTRTPGGPAPTRVAVLDNICNAGQTTSGAAITIRAASRIAVVGNVCRAGTSAGIEISSTIGPAEDIDVADNVVLESGNRPSPPQGSGTGIKLSALRGASAGDLRRVNVRNNIVAAPRYHGIALVGGGVDATARQISNVTISGNQIWMNKNATYLDPLYKGAGIACVDPTLDVIDVSIRGNDVRNAVAAGIHAEKRSTDIIANQIPAPAPQRWEICENNVTDSGASAQSPGILIDALKDVTLAGNRAQDTGAQTQTYGVRLINPTGTVVIVGNTVTGNLIGGVSFTGAEGTDRLRIRDNAGFNPWVGEVSLPGATWVSQGSPPGGPPFVQNLPPVVLSAAPHVAFPNGKAPQLIATVKAVGTEEIGVFAVAKNVSNTSFVLRAVASSAKPIQDHKISWIAEPLD